MMMAKNRDLCKAERIFGQMCQLIRDAGDSGLRVDQVERSLFQLAIQLCLTLLVVFVKSVGPGDDRPVVRRRRDQR
jgi:hypothetical protein